MFRHPILWSLLLAVPVLVAVSWTTSAAPKHQRFTAKEVFQEFTDRVYQPDLCGKRCRDAGASCMAWSYEGPPPRAPLGATSRCLLLSRVNPHTVPDSRFVSALAEEALPGDRDNQCVNILPVGFPLYVPALVATPNPGICAAKCRDTPTCRAWTYHKLLTGFGSPPMSCSLTGQDPPTFTSSPGCLSGLR